MNVIRNQSDLKNIISNRRLNIPEVESSVKEILNNVKIKGDQALKDYTEIFDKVQLKSLKISKSDIKSSKDRLPRALKEALEIAYERIYAFHLLQKSDSKTLKGRGYQLEERLSPLESVGLYVPGGKAAYPSTVLMNAIPAKIAGVNRIVMVTPPNEKGRIKDSVLYAAYLVGVDEIYCVGGAQSIAALSYGTETIKAVDKIVGPGNRYVSAAKKIVSDFIGIDMIAGPSEILILADEASDVSFIAADMIAQAEHDEKAMALVMTTCESLVEPLKASLIEMVKDHPREGIIKRALEDFGIIYVSKSIEEIIDLCNWTAPEHLEILLKNPRTYVSTIRNAGAIFLGPYTPEVIGDYIAGPNHTLPTHGTAKFSSPLNVADFMKKTSILEFNRQAMDEVSNYVCLIAEDEGLIGHKRAIEIRRSKDDKNKGL
jgi:histidinol dehydrogenase